MKRLFTLALVMLVTFAGYSQVKSMPMNKGMRKMATQQKVGRTDIVNANVESQPNMVRFDFGQGELDYSTYDWQTNAGPINRTIVWPDGKVNFAFTMASETNYSNRGTAIGTYDYFNDEWIPSEGRVETEKTGFGSICRYKENGIVIAAHTDTQCGFYILEDRDNLAPNSIPRALTFDPTIDPCWPVVMTSGPNRDIIHIVATGYSDNKLYYFRSRDGETWDVENVILPYLSPEYGSDWGSNVCYWMETTEDNRLALVVNNTWSDCMVIYSYDDGETWERKVFWHHPGINNTIENWFMYPRWTSCVWGLNDQLCVAYEFNGSSGEPGSSSYYPSIGGVAFWSEYMPYHGDGSSFPNGYDPTNPMPPVPGQPFIMDSAYIYNDIYASLWMWGDASHEMWPEYFGYLPEAALNIEDLSLHGSYNCGCVAMPFLCKVPGSDMDFVAVWITMDGDTPVDENGNYYFKLWASYSGDGGLTWYPQVYLSDDFMLTYTEHVYPQAAVIDNTLIVAVQTDGLTDTYVMGSDNDPNDNLYTGFTYDLNELFPGVGVPEIEHNNHITVYPNPAVDQLNVTLNKNAKMTISNIIGQVIMHVEGHAGANTLDISNLNSGIYFLNAGNDTQKFVVK